MLTLFTSGCISYVIYYSWRCLATDIWKKIRLNWKLKISNAADNADITELQACDTRHRRMREVNSLCMDR